MGYKIFLLQDSVLKVNSRLFFFNYCYPVAEMTAFTAASEFCEQVQVGIDVYIPHRKYQVKSHLSPWFSAACAAAIAHTEIIFFVCTNRINLLNLN